MSTVLLDAGDMRRTLGRMAHAILEANQGAENLAVVGVLKGGYPVAKRLAWLMTQAEGITVPCGKLDIRGYRDDTKLPPEQEASEVPFDVNDKRVILVDEVIFTGRTVRAALDALMRFGRPQVVQLAVLIDRGHRELPIQPDFCGKVIASEPSDHVLVEMKETDGEDRATLQHAKPEEALVR
jgi:pyrimidine operon attenuation protein/uracil phosphoribosyltransferase